MFHNLIPRPPPICTCKQKVELGNHGNEARTGSAYQLLRLTGYTGDKEMRVYVNS